MKVTLELSERQAKIVQSALDIYTRLGLGQIERVGDFLDWKTRDQWEQLLAAVKVIGTGHHPNASTGISHPELDDRFKIAYEIQQVVRGKVAWHNKPEGGWTVDFDDPLKLSQEPLPECQVDE